MISLFTLKVFQNSLMLIFSYVKKEKLNQWNAIQYFYDIAYRYESISIECFYQLDALNLCKNGL